MNNHLEPDRLKGTYQLAIIYQWSEDVDGRLTAPDDSRHWVYLDRWTSWTLWRRLALERVVS
jgi:hypothetical protein